MKLCFTTLVSAVLFVRAYGADPSATQTEAVPTAGPDGRLKAAYFNPHPTHVARVAWKYQGGHLGVFVELRAPNYPGSTYSLAFDQARDRLVGTYFQAAMQLKFVIEFERIP